MKLSPQPFLPFDFNGLRVRLFELLRDIINQLNSVSRGEIVNRFYSDVKPITTNHNKGDVCLNSNTVVIAIFGGNYILEKWIFDGTSWQDAYVRVS